MMYDVSIMINDSFCKCCGRFFESENSVSKECIESKKVTKENKMADELLNLFEDFGFTSDIKIDLNDLRNRIIKIIQHHCDDDLSEKRRELLKYFLQCYNKENMIITGLDVNKLRELSCKK